MMDVVFTLFTSLILENAKFQVFAILGLLYIIYYYKYGFYIFRQKKNYTQGKHRIGKTLPAHPNGWFIILSSRDLKKGQTKYVDAHGESLAVFRANNGNAYVISAFCPHLNANLGIEGKVVHDSCIQCPFHAWTIDGETGNCVVGKEKRVKEGIQYEYEFDSNNECYEFKAKKEEKIKIKKYLSREQNGYIFVWFSAKKNEGNSDKEFVPPYEPLDLSEHLKRLYHRGFSLNLVNAHISDIAENGGDLLHFKYIHSSIIPFLVWGSWDAKWIRADDPKLREKLHLKDPKQNEYRNKLLDKFLTEKNKKYIGVIHLFNELNIMNIIDRQHFFTLTGFQVGPGLVYLFIQGKFFETMLIQHIDTREKYHQDVYHEIYCDWMSPYWFSALQLRLEVRQVLNDGVIWDNKKFAYKSYFSKTVEEDDYLITWRKWFSQFYDGCKQEEEKNNSLTW